MSYKWDTHIPDGINERTWRRMQIAQYCKIYPQSKPRDIMNWLGEQTPNPWPSCNSNIVSKILRRLRKSKETGGLVISASFYQKSGQNRKNKNPTLNPRETKKNPTSLFFLAKPY